MSSIAKLPGRQDFELRLPRLELEAGGAVESHVVRGYRWGPEDPLAPAVLIVHALTADARVDDWWGPLLGPGRALDPRRFRILSFDLLGSCHGSSGPGTAGFPDEAQLTTWDQARSLLLALDAMEIERLHLCVGGSLGGMVALCLAALAPERVERIAPIAAAAASSAWVVGWNHVARQILELDGGPRGLSLARQLAMLTYRAEAGLDSRQPRGVEPPWTRAPVYPIQGYLEHQGSKLVDRFDSRAYRVLLDAMDHHDLSRPPPSPGQNESWSKGPRWGIERIQASTLAVSVDTDQLFFPAQTEALARELRACGVFVEERIIHSPHGHDAFLIEWEQMAAVISSALELPLPLES